MKKNTKNTKKAKLSVNELVDFFYISISGKLWRYDGVTEFLVRYLKVTSCDSGRLERELFKKIISLSRSEKFFALCYILEKKKYVYFKVNKQGVPSIIDKTHLCHRLMDDLGFCYKNKKSGFSAESDSVNIIKGSLFVNSKWLHI